MHYAMQCIAKKKHKQLLWKFIHKNIKKKVNKTNQTRESEMHRNEKKKPRNRGKEKKRFLVFLRVVVLRCFSRPMKRQQPQQIDV